ncbi:MAG: GMC family oxidoreductase N-terminal domain-containing protein, partial [Methyloligellaceae bacterium]
MRRLSKTVSDIRLNYDVVVVGSGYGGGVAASRLARCGKRVCVLERGKEFAIGNFPDRPLEAQREFQVTTGSRHIGSPLGLYDLRMGEDIHVFVGCGLGGTSLINANVSIKADPRVWKDPVWPETLAGDADLAVGEARAERMLKPVPYPNRTPLPKLLALEKSAQAMGQTADRVPINVTFGEGLNHAGVFQPPCTLCGDCCSGCNVGAKTTVQMTYLPDAANHGADIFTGTLVRSLRKERGKWRIFFELMGHEREKFGTPEQSITADIVVLAAGTLGSTEILLRSQTTGLRLSEQLGQNFTGNGDVLAFGYNNDQPINGIGFGHPPQVDIGPVGPCITGVIDCRETSRLEDGFIIEEGSIPSGLAPLLPPLMVGGSVIFGDDTDFGFVDEAQEAGRGLQSLFLGAYKGAVNRTQTFLVMAHDDAGGQMRLEEDRLTVKWEGVARLPIFEAIDAKL